MTKNSGGATVNQGGASKPTQDEAAREFDIAGNAAEKGEEPSPGKRDRGETSSTDPGAPVDLDSAHDRAS
jgi:hypothetical protein